MVVSHSRRPQINYDEDKVPKYTLPDPLVAASGEKVTSAEAWRNRRRPELLQLFETHVYGKSPGKPPEMSFEVTSSDPKALGGKATRKEVAIRLTSRKDGPTINLLVYVPNGKPRPVPAFLGLNFYGNHTVHGDPGITLSTAWMRDNKELGVVNNRATEKSRGARRAAGRWRWCCDRGYATGHRLLRRHRSRLRRRLCQRRASAVLQAGPDAAGRRRMGLDRRLGLGPEPRDGLPRDRRRHRCPPRGRAWPFAAGQDVPLGRRDRRAVRPGHLQQLRLRRRGPLAAASSARPWPRSTSRSRTGSATTSTSTTARSTTCRSISTC